MPRLIAFALFLPGFALNPYPALSETAPSAATATDQGQSTVETPAALTVSIIKPLVQTWPITVPGSGFLQAWHEAVVASEISGLRVTAVNVEVGDIVLKGESLAKLSDASVVTDVSQAQAALNSAKASLNQATANDARGRKLDGSGAVSQQQINDYQIEKETAQATVDSEQAALDAEKIRLSQTNIVAPDDGVISSTAATLGSVVTSGTEMFRMIRQGRIEWQAQVSPRFAALLAVGQTATIPVPGGTVTGKVRLIAPSVDQASGRITVYVALPANDGKGHEPHVGLYATGEISVGEASALTVPESAVLLRDGFSYVFTLNPDNTVSRRRVETDRRQSDAVELTSGLDGDADVVLSGGAFLADGATVKVVAQGGPSK